MLPAADMSCFERPHSSPSQRRHCHYRIRTLRAIVLGHSCHTFLGISRAQLVPAGRVDRDGPWWWSWQHSCNSQTVHRRRRWSHRGRSHRDRQLRIDREATQAMALQSASWSAAWTNFASPSWASESVSPHCCPLAVDWRSASTTSTSR
jgi:hypothetical protein